jgi:hypothetical protein
MRALIPVLLVGLVVAAGIIIAVTVATAPALDRGPVFAEPADPACWCRPVCRCR